MIFKNTHVSQTRMFIKCHLRTRENYGLLGDRRMWQKITFETASTPAAHIRTKLFLSSHQKPFWIIQSHIVVQKV